MCFSTKTTDPTIELVEDGRVKMLRVVDPEVREVLVPIQEDDTLEEHTTLDVITELTEEELEEEFNKLSASDKIRYNQWVEFHAMNIIKGCMALQECHLKLFVTLVT